jgi:hypothetical protein
VPYCNKLECLPLQYTSILAYSLRYSTLMVGSSLYCNYTTRVELNDSSKHSSLLRQRIKPFFLWNRPSGKNKLERLCLASFFQPSLIFGTQTESYQVVHTSVPYSGGKLIRKFLPWTNALAYFGNTEKSLLSFPPRLSNVSPMIFQWFHLYLDLIKLLTKLG